MAKKKSGFEQARASALKAIRNFEETVSGMVGFDEPEKKKKAKKKSKKRKNKKRGGR